MTHVTQPGPDSFIDLSDTPNTYSGSGGKSVVVNGSATALEFATATAGSYQVPTSGSVDGSNATFVFATAPDVIVVDQGRPMQKTSSDGTVNWTGTTTVTLTIPPTFDIFAL